MISNLNKQEIPAVRQARVNHDLDHQHMSSLGQRLYDIAEEIEFSDEPSLDESAIEKELTDRRGGDSELPSTNP